MLDGPHFWEEGLDMADVNDRSIQQPPVVHVLAVDDSIVDRLVIQRLLMACSYKVTVVDSASRALEFLGLTNPSNANGLDVNLIITDYGMPGMTGYDLLKKLKETSAFKEIPVVIVSSENVPSRTNMCLAEGAEEFLMKPLQKSDIERLQDQIIEPRAPYMIQSSNLRRKNGSNGVNHASCDAIIKTPLESCKESSRFNTNSPPRHRRLSLDNLHSPYPQHRAQAAFYAEI